MTVFTGLSIFQVADIWERAQKNINFLDIDMETITQMFYVWLHYNLIDLNWFYAWEMKWEYVINWKKKCERKILVNGKHFWGEKSGVKMLVSELEMQKKKTFPN